MYAFCYNPIFDLYLLSSGINTAEAATLISHCTGDEINTIAAVSIPNIGISEIKYPNVTIISDTAAAIINLDVLKFQYKILPIANPIIPFIINVAAENITYPLIKSAKECPIAPTNAPATGPRNAAVTYIILSPK